MANPHGYARTSAVRVKDPVAFRSFCGQFDVHVEESRDRASGDLVFTVHATEDTGWLPICTTEGEDCDNFLSLMAEHLAEGEILVGMGSGRMKSELWGFADAIAANGDSVQINLSDIWGRIEQALPGRARAF